MTRTAERNAAELSASGTGFGSVILPAIMSGIALAATTCSPTECTKALRRRQTDDRAQAVENSDDVPLPQRVFG
ncbi:MAG: hypothetical protein QOE62_124 [Actinomycetota bacterium]|nr:hypothetical protein [Actinomycetota bacterium]